MFDSMLPDEVSFLDRHKIALSQLCDLDGRPVSDCFDEMVADECLFGYNADSCTAGTGHKFVTRAGQCIQCEPSGAKAIAEMRRNHGLGDVYIAGSLSSSLLKIGSAINADKRLPAENVVSYGGANDWRKLHVVRAIANSGKVEFAIHTRLAKYRVRNVSYMKDGKELPCYELFSCSMELALEAFQASVPKGSKIASLIHSELGKYSFPDSPTSRVMQSALTGAGPA